ncbi:hypothetical protein Q0590_34940 [Rhodocytophaga aerolata]|uniref:Uncharacterized protein n=1 Tax=Rhodocytophaga aerolata TaxID=455078 RepID=A0ABT8RHE7_9BACT|nr:hypothetical protein [Rhodocytophaga aerolata]MDO1451522.1 hypothetical protein [Rhodocytophaga aerolata]
MDHVLCFKWCYREGIYHYCKLYASRQPPAQVVVNFSKPDPIIDFFEFNLRDPDSQLLYSDLFESSTPIECWEYEAAYRRATSQEFDLYINGRKQRFTLL